MVQTRKMFEHKFTFGKGSLATVSTEHNILAIYSQKEKFGFASFNDNEIIPFITQHNSFICEVLHKYPKKAYFDIDISETKSDDLINVKEVIKQFFGDESLAISGYESLEKNSFHIILPNLIITDDIEMMQLKKTVVQMKKQFDGFDDKVYTSKRLMKCVNQSKIDKPIQKIIENDNIQNHLIGCFFTGHERKIIVQPQPFAEFTSIKPFIDLPQLSLPESFSIEDLEDNLKLLRLTPTNQNLGHDHTWKVCMFCKSNGITLNQFLEWAKQKDNSIERMNKWTNYWNTKKFYPITKKGFIEYLKLHYKDLELLNSNMSNLNFKSTNQLIKSLAIESVKIDSLEQTHFNTGHRAVVLNVSMGKGKTFQTVNYLKDSFFKLINTNFIWCCNRVSLTRNTYARFVKLKMNVVNYLDCGKKRIDRVANCRNATQLMISTESLNFLEDEDCNKFDVLVIDEVESLLKSLDSKTHGANIDINWLRLQKLIKECKQVIFMDAFTTKHTLELLEKLGFMKNEIIVYSNKEKPTQRLVKQLHSMKAVEENIINDLKQNKKVYCFYAYKSGRASAKNSSGRLSIEDFADNIREKTSKKVLVYHGDSDDVVKLTLSNVNKVWDEYDMILTTSCITVGVSYEGLSFDKGYFLIEPWFNTVRDVMQSTMRIRNLSENIIYIYFFSTQMPMVYKNPESYERSDEIYKSVINNIVIERQSDFLESFLEFCSKANYKCNDIIMKKFNERFENLKFVSKMLISYDDLPEIDTDEKDLLERDYIFPTNATMKQKLTVKRYFFDLKFTNLTLKERAYVWDNNYEKFFDNIDSVLIQQVKIDNSIEHIIDLDINDAIVSETTKKYIETHFQTKSKSATLLLSNVLNVEIGLGFIHTESDKYRNKTYEISDESKVLYELYLKL